MHIAVCMHAMHTLSWFSAAVAAFEKHPRLRRCISCCRMLYWSCSGSTRPRSILDSGNRDPATLICICLYPALQWCSTFYAAVQERFLRASIPIPQAPLRLAQHQCRQSHRKTPYPKTLRKPQPAPVHEQRPQPRPQNEHSLGQPQGPPQRRSRSARGRCRRHSSGMHCATRSTRR